MSDNHERPLSGGYGEVLKADSLDGVQSSRCQETSHAGSKNDECSEEAPDFGFLMKYELDFEE